MQHCSLSLSLSRLGNRSDFCGLRWASQSRMGNGTPLVRYLCTTWTSLQMFFTKTCPSGGTKYVCFELFSAFLGAWPGAGGGAPGTVPLHNPQITSRKACLRKADQKVKKVEQCQVVVFVADDLGFLGPGIPDLVTELCPSQDTA